MTMIELPMRIGARALVLFLSFVYLGCGAPGQELSADMAIMNANVITVDEENPRVEAVAVRGGRIVAVGSSSHIERLIGEKTQVIDGRGKTVLPGFIDAHMHPRPLFPYESVHHVIDLSPDSVETMDELIEALREKASVTPPGQWVRGSRYQDTKLGRHPTRQDLDQASTEHPIRITHSSGHASVVNSLVIERGEVTRDTPDPPGARFGRDENGEATGVLFEGPAFDVASRGSPLFPTPNRSDEVEGILLAFQKFLSVGITTVHDASATSDMIRLYQDALERGQPVRVYMLVRGGDRWGPSQILQDFSKTNIRTGFGNDRLKVGGVKITHGNSLSARTCWLYEPYAHDSDYYGVPPGRSQEDLNQLMLDIHESGFQPAVHSNGDREIDMVLDAFEYALEKLPKEDHRFRIEHFSVVTPEILQRASAIGIVAVLHSYTWEHGDKYEDYGEDRWNLMHPNRSAVEAGIHVAQSSDFGVSAADPLLRIQSLVTRMSAEGKVYGPEQRISPEEAIRLWTLAGAYAAFEEDVKGSIELGKLADFVILSDDPTAVPPETIKDIAVEMTVIGGVVEYERPMSSDSR